MKTLNLEQMANVQGGSFWGWVGAGAACIAGAAFSVATYGAGAEVGAVLCGGAIAAAS